MVTYDPYLELSSDQIELLDTVWGRGNPEEEFTDKFNIECTRANLKTLRPGVWLDDEVVNFYFHLVKERSDLNPDLPKAHIFNTHFYPKLLKDGHAKIKRWTKKVDIFAKDLVLVPIHLGNHWTLAVIDFRIHTISYMDSFHSPNQQCLNALLRYLEDESQEKKKEPLKGEWTLCNRTDIPEQHNGCDCGVFMSINAEYQGRDIDLDYTQLNMDYFRERMLVEIVDGKLFHPHE